MEQWRERGPDTDVRLGGEETVLGRRTQIVELRPAWRSGASSAATAPSEGEEAAPPVDGAASSGGVVRVLIDPERMFIMRWAVDGEGGGQSYSAEVTALEYGEPIDEVLFAFEPPPDAREVSAPDSGGGCSGMTLGGLGFGVPASFLRPSYLPSGHGSSASGAESGADGCGPVATWALLEDGDGGYVLLRQRVRADGVPAALRTGEAVRVGGHDGFASQDAGVVQLVWAEGEIVAQLTSNALSLEELLRIAESAALVATGDG